MVSRNGCKREIVMEGREFRWRILVAMAEKTALIESQCKAD